MVDMSYYRDILRVSWCSAQREIAYSGIGQRSLERVGHVDDVAIVSSQSWVLTTIEGRQMEQSKSRLNQLK